MKARPAARWAVYLLIAIAFAIACAFLSNWQFARNAERAKTLALVEANYDAEPAALADLVAGTSDFDPGDQWRPVRLTGEYLADDELLVRNRPQGGTSAFEVLVPLRLDDGRVIAVDRGWLPPGEGERPDDVPAPPKGEVTVVARLQPGEALPQSGRSAPDGQLPTLHLPSVAEVTGPDTITSVYGLMVSEDPSPAQRPHQVAPPTDDPGPHLSYAIQWILFGVAGFVFIGYVIRIELRARREEAEEPQDGTTPAPPHAPRRRRDRDADEEDALLDQHPRG